MGIPLTLALPVVGFPGSCGDGQLAACASGTCPDMHGQTPQQGNALDATGKADGGSYGPGETIALAATGGGQYALYAEAGGVQLVRSDNAPTSVRAPLTGTLTLLSIRAGGRNQCTYELITLASDGTTPPSGGGTPPGGGGGGRGGGGVGNVGGVGNGNPGAGSSLSAKGEYIPDAGTGLLYSTLVILFVHVVQRRVRAVLKANRRHQLFTARKQGVAITLQAGGAPPPPPTFTASDQQQNYGWPAYSPPSSPPQLAFPPPPPPPPAPPGNFDPASDWTPQWDASGNQYFWNMKTGAVQWEPPGLPTPSATPPPPPPAKYFNEGYGLSTAPIEVDVLPILPAGARRQTLSTPKDAAGPRSARAVRLAQSAGAKMWLLDASCGEVLVFSLYLLLNMLWCTLFAKKAWYVADSWGYVASANGLFVVIPASRNGVWAWLLGLPFDKTITIHRCVCTGLEVGRQLGIGW